MGDAITGTTNKDMYMYRSYSVSTKEGKIFVPKGSKVDWNTRCRCWFVCPKMFPAMSIEHHDAVHYGFRVNEVDVDKDGAK